ncbi:hypothetical protein ACT4UM_01615, partial [Bacillus sp. SS-TM]
MIELAHLTDSQLLGPHVEPLEFSHSARFTQAIQMVCRKLSLHTKLTIIPAHASEVNTVAFEFFQGVIPDLFIVQDSEKTRALTQAAWFGSSQPQFPRRVAGQQPL